MQRLRRAAIAVFDRTFRITYALEAVAVFVAVMGIAGSLLAMVIDRRREFALLRFLGAAKPQVRKIILCEAGLLGPAGQCNWPACSAQLCRSSSSSSSTSNRSVGLFSSTGPSACSWCADAASTSPPSGWFVSRRHGYPHEPHGGDP